MSVEKKSAAAPRPEMLAMVVLIIGLPGIAALATINVKRIEWETACLEAGHPPEDCRR